MDRRGFGLEELDNMVPGSFHVEWLAGKQIYKREVLFGICMEGNMALGDNSDAGNPFIFRYLPLVSKYVWLCYLCHTDLLGQVIQQVEAGIEIIQDCGVTLSQIQHQMGAVSIHHSVHSA